MPRRPHPGQQKASPQPQCARSCHHSRPHARLARTVVHHARPRQYLMACEQSRSSREHDRKEKLSFMLAYDDMSLAIAHPPLLPQRLRSHSHAPHTKQCGKMPDQAWQLL